MVFPYGKDSKNAPGGLVPTLRGQILCTGIFHLVPNILIHYNRDSTNANTPAPEPLAARKAGSCKRQPLAGARLFLKVSSSTDHAGCSKRRPPPAFRCPVQTPPWVPDRGRGCGALSHKNPFQKTSPSLSSAFTSSTLRHEQRKMSPCHRHGKGESPQGTTKQPLHEPASLFA